ncbi:tRNA (guanosine(46)-N7)-methyltransferase TrmB [Salibacterium lacus]|uniref:tRNA (guanine-N(7)-)-methyltransferase n=1 Tax=Salibacterium lacus TaxID=1898109 RepID=A0ABW5T0S8_9BACI
MRLRRKPWAGDWIQQHPELVISDSSQVADGWRELFGNDNPVHVELGTGKGKFIDEMSRAYPDINFIGMEKYESVLVTGMQRILHERRENIRFIHGDVLNLLDFFDENEVDRLFINFTDPWPKKRHEKRRLTHKTFLDLYEKVLRNEHDIHMKTDNQTLFEYSLESMSRCGMVLKNVSLDLHNSNMEHNIMTEYERKFYQKEQPIFRLEAFFPDEKAETKE